MSSLDSELREEQVRNFSINQEVDRYIRKGKQPAKNQTGQRTSNSKSRHDDYSTKNLRASSNLVSIPQDDFVDDLKKSGSKGHSDDPYGRSSTPSRSTNDDIDPSRMSIDTV